MPTEPKVPPQPVWITGNWASEYERPDAIAYVPASVADTYRNERNQILTEIVVRSGKSMDLDFNRDLVAQARQALEALVPASALAPLVRALEKIADGDIDCNCTHEDEFCCVAQKHYCPFCIAVVALRDATLSAGQKES